MKTVTRANLKNQIGMIGPRPFLYCEYCGAEYSANAGDYWDLPDTHIFECCGVPNLLVTKQITLTEVE